MKKLVLGFLSLIMCYAMVSVVMPSEAFAADGDTVNYNLWVGDTRVTSDAMSGDGWSYEGDSSSGTLTLTDANITSSHGFGLAGQRAGIYARDIELTIKLVGKNTISPGNDSSTDGIYMDEDLIITGDGSLDIDAGHNGIDGHAVTFDDTTVSIKGGYRCIYANGARNIVINGGKVDLKNDDGYGAFCGVLKMSDNAELTVKVGRDGLETDRAEIKDSVLTLETGNYRGLYAQTGDVIIENSEVSAKSRRDCAIECYSDDCYLYIIGSKVTAESDSVAIWANTMTVRDGSGSIDTYVEAKTNSSDRPAVFCENTDGITLEDGIDIKTPEGGSVGSYVVSGSTGVSINDVDGIRAGHVILVHHELELIEGTDATCTEQGAEDYYTCSICGRYFSDENGKNEIDKDSWIIPATGHDWGEWSQTKAPTCSAEGEEERVCANDQSHKETREVAVDPEAHKWDEGRVTKEPTEKAEGVKTYTCEICQETRTEAIPKLKPAPAAKVSGTLLVVMKARGKAALDITWTKVRNADGYDIFLARCDSSSGKTYACRKVKTVKGSGTLKWTKKGLKKGKAYKAVVKAYVMKDGKKTYVRTSPMVHAFTSGGTKIYTNPGKVTVKKANVSLKAGKTYRIKAGVTKLRKGKKLISSGHAPKLRYLSSNTKIAKVSRSGKITAVSKGSCRVYAIAVNGASKAITVTVK